MKFRLLARVVKIDQVTNSVTVLSTDFNDKYNVPIGSCYPNPNIADLVVLTVETTYPNMFSRVSICQITN